MAGLPPGSGRPLQPGCPARSPLRALRAAPSHHTHTQAPSFSAASGARVTPVPLPGLLLRPVAWQMLCHLSRHIWNTTFSVTHRYPALQRHLSLVLWTHVDIRADFFSCFNTFPSSCIGLSPFPYTSDRGTDLVLLDLAHPTSTRGPGSVLDKCVLEGELGSGRGLRPLTPGMSLVLSTYFLVST